MYNMPQNQPLVEWNEAIWISLGSASQLSKIDIPAMANGTRHFRATVAIV